MLMLNASSAEVPQGGARELQQVVLTPNEALRRLVEASGLPQAVAMTIFNRQLGNHGCSESEWRGFLADPGSPRYRELNAAQLSHALIQFARIGVQQVQNPA